MPETSWPRTKPASRCASRAWVTTFPQKYDVVIVTPGGFPRDIDLHQAQKAMSTAEQVAAEAGVIVLLAECADGIGRFAALAQGGEESAGRH